MRNRRVPHSRALGKRLSANSLGSLALRLKLPSPLSHRDLRAIVPRPLLASSGPVPVHTLDSMRRDCQFRAR